MPIQPEEIGNFADDIAEMYSQEEVGLRVAVSKLYYSVFLHSRERLNVRQRRHSHEAVGAEVAKQTRGATGSIFKDLRELREQADYELEHDRWDEKWKRAKRLAERIMAELGKRGYG